MKVLKQYWRDHHGRDFPIPARTDALVNFYAWLTDVKYKDKPGCRLPSPPMAPFAAILRVQECDYLLL